MKWNQLDLSRLAPQLMRFLLCLKPWRGVGAGAVQGASVLVPRGSEDDSVPASLPPPTHRSTLTPPALPHGARGMVAGSIVCPHKGQEPFSVQMWPRSRAAAAPSSPPPRHHGPAPASQHTEPVGRIPFEQGSQEALRFCAQKLGHAKLRPEIAPSTHECAPRPGGPPPLPSSVQASLHAQFSH